MPRKIAVGGSVRKKKAHFKDQKEFKVDSDQIKEKYKVRIPLKSPSASFPDVLRIIEKRPNWTEDKVRFVTFDELNDDLKEIIDISMGWKVFRLYIDGIEIKSEQIRVLMRVLFCNEKIECQGICSHRALRHYSPADIIRILKSDETDRNEWEQKYLLREKSWVYVEGDPESAQKAILNHKELLLKLKKNLELEDKYCQIFNWSLMEDKISELPKKIDLNPSFTREGRGLERFKSQQESLDFDPNKEETDEEEKVLFSSDVLIYIDEKIEDLAQKIGEEVGKVLKKTLEDAGIVKK